MNGGFDGAPCLDLPRRETRRLSPGRPAVAGHSATMRLGGGFRLGFHESLNPAFWQGTGRPTPRPEERIRDTAAG